jgi:hypothetical protein
MACKVAANGLIPITRRTRNAGRHVDAPAVAWNITNCSKSAKHPQWSVQGAALWRWAGENEDFGLEK